MALPITTSPDITSLDFSILYDLSGGLPAITLTNNSIGNPSGTTGLSNCSWWYVITTPSGIFIHDGNSTTPDVPAANWTTITVPDAWPTPFGTPPCGQVEFSTSVPYSCTLFVKDSTSAIFSLQKTTIIARPSGSKEGTCGSFGQATYGLELQCNNAKIYANDTTNYTYQNLLGTSQASTWTLTYPPDASGNIPANAVATNAPFVYFPIGYSGAGYMLYLNTFSTYNLGNGCSVKIQYKSQSNFGTKPFSVFCGVDLCSLQCEMEKFEQVVNRSCGSIEYPSLKDKMTQITFLYNQVLTGLIQPLCNIDVPSIIRKIEEIGAFSCGGCGCSTGINVSNSNAAVGAINLVTHGNIAGSVTNNGGGIYNIDLTVINDAFVAQVGGVTSGGFTITPTTVGTTRTLTFNLVPSLLPLFAQGGNSFGAPAVLGTIDSNTLTFLTNNVAKGSFATTGQFSLSGGVDEAVLSINNSISTTPQTNKLFIGIGNGIMNTANTGFISFGSSLLSANPAIGFNTNRISFVGVPQVLFNNSNGIDLRSGGDGSTTNYSQFGFSGASNSSAVGYSPLTGIVNWMIAPLNSGTNSQFNPVGGSAIFNIFNIDPIINATGSYTGTTRGIFINPTLTSGGASWRSMEWTNTLGFGLYGSGIAPNYINGALYIGNSSGTSKVDITGAQGYTQLRLRTSYTPTGTADANGSTGDVAWDVTYWYWKTSNGWLRTTGSTF